MADKSDNRKADGVSSESATQANLSESSKSRRGPRREQPGPGLELAPVDIKAQLKDTSEALKQRDRELKQLQRQYERVETQLDKKNAQLDERTRSLRQREQKVRTAASSLEELHRTHETLSHEYEELKQEHEAALHAFQERAAEYELAESKMREMLAGRLAEQQVALEAEHAQSLDRLRAELGAESDHERELRDRIDRMEHERDQAKEALFEARQQLEEHRHAFEAVRSRFAENQQERRQLQDEIEQLREVLSQASVGVAGELSEQFAAGAPGGSSRIVGVAALLVLVAVSVGLGLFTWWQNGSQRERMVGTLVVPGGDARLIAQCVEEGRQARESGIETAGIALDPVAERGVVQITLDLDRAPVDVGSARERIDTFGEYIARQMRFFTPTSKGIDFVDAFETAAAGIRHEFDRLGITADSPAAPEATAELDKLEQFLAAYAQRRQVASVLAEADASVEQLSAPITEVNVSDERLSAARLNHQMQLADMAELEQREAKLRSALLSTLSGSEEDFATLAREVVEGTKYTEDLKSRGYGDDVNALLDALTAAMVQWRDAAAALKQTWDAELQTLSIAGAADPAASLDQLEQAVRGFTEDVRKGMEQYDQTIGLLDQGGEQPSTRVVLRRNVELRLGTAVRACDPLIANARSMLPENDAVLETLARSIAGLRERVTQRDAELIETLKQQLLAEEQERRAVELGTAVARRDELRGQVAALDERLAAATMNPGALRTLLSGDDLNDDRQLAALSKHVASLDTVIGRLRDGQAVPASMSVTYVPAEVVVRPMDNNRRTQQALIVGTIPMAGAMLLLVLMAVVRSYQRGEDSIREVADALHSATAPPAATDGETAGQ